MTKFLAVYASLLVFLASSVAAMPQERLAPAVEAAHSLPARGLAYASIQPRQVHNADYGSNNGPTGNPQPAQQTASPDSSPKKGSDDPDSTPKTADDSSKEQKRRGFVLHPSQDVNYS